MMDAKIGLLVGLLEDQQRKNAAAAAAAKKAQQAAQGGQGGEGGEGGEAGQCGGAKQPCSPQAQQGARECQSACGAQKQQAVGEGGCQGTSPERMQAQMPPRPARGIGEDNPSPDAQDPVRNPPRNPTPDVQDPVRNPPRNPSPDLESQTPNNPSPDAAAAATRRVTPNAAVNAQTVANAATAEQLRRGREEGERSALSTTGDARVAESAHAKDVSANKRVADGHAAFAKPPANAATAEQLRRGREEGERSAAPTATGDARAAEIAQQQRAETKAPPKNEKLEKVLKENPSIKTNQDLINHLYKQGGGDWAGAVKQAKEAGVKMTELLADRRGDVAKRVGGEPAAPPPAPPAPPTPPARQEPPARVQDPPPRTMVA